MSRHVYLVGSVPLDDERQVFETVSAALGPRLKRIPDGETGERGDWIVWLEPVFANSKELELSDEIFKLHATAPGRRRYRLKPGHAAKDIRFDNLFYADIAIRSYASFAALKAILRPMRPSPPRNLSRLEVQLNRATSRPRQLRPWSSV